MNGNPFYFTFGVTDFERARAFFAELFDWDVTEEGHIANLALCGGIAPASFGVGPTLYLAHDDVPAGVARVRELGGTAGEPTTARSGEYANCVDDQGTAFSIGWTHPEMEAEQIAGLTGRREAKAVLGYLTLGAPDVDRAAAFYGNLFGWKADAATPGTVEGSSYRHVTSTALPLGFTDQSLDLRLHLYFRVEDGPTTAKEVERLGGTVANVGESESGYNADCHDDQGTPFSLWQASRGF